MLEDLLGRDMMIFDLKANDKMGVLKELIGVLTKKEYITDGDEFLNVVLKREEEYTTGIGMGIAIPHGKSDVVKKAAVVFGKSKEGIEYHSMDKKPAYLFFLIAAPENSDDVHLKVLAKLSRSLMHKEVREALFKAKNPDDVFTAFEKY